MKITTAALLILWIGAPARADTLHVPATHPTIQAAIDVASDGDLVRVAPGTYVETIDFLGKAITVESRAGAELTIIDAAGAGSVATFVNDERNDSVLRGFTLTGGTGTAVGTALRGGGIFASGAEPTIERCVITLNTADEGGGASFAGDQLDERPLLSDCVLSGNTAWAGGGFHVRNGHLAVRRCTISDNTAETNGGGGYFGNGLFGFPGWQLVVQGCVISGNTAGTHGGGLFVSVNGDFFGANTALVERCDVVDNEAGSDGGGLALWAMGTGARADVRNAVVARNVAGSFGGGIRHFGAGDVEFCTITANAASTGGGLVASPDHSPDIRHCIVWGNAGGEIFVPTALSVAWCDVRGGWAGTGNLDVDPFFVDAAGGDYRLAPTSACQDAGDPADPGLGTDFEGDPRKSGAAVDIGADEATFPKSPWTHLGHALAGASGVPSLVGTGTLLPAAPTTLTLEQAAPLSATFLVAGTSFLGAPFQGGILVPDAGVVVDGLSTNGAGAIELNGRWPPGVPSGASAYVQCWIGDAAGPLGFAASNGLSATAP